MQLTMRRLSLVEFGAIAYLTAPLLVFCVSFLTIPLAIYCSATIVFVLYRIIKNTTFHGVPTVSDALLVLIVTAWIIAAGVTTISYQTFDWPKHYAIFDALNGPWPAVRESGLYLRYGLGFYIVPSLLANLIGLPVAIAVWCILGLWLGFRLIITGPRPSIKQTLIVAVTLIFFSGMDYVGNTLFDAKLLAPWHLEWWIRFGQISSISTSLAWAPQHAIPTIIIGGFFFRRVETLQADALLLVALLFWSPLTAIGALPFFALRWIRLHRILMRSPEYVLLVPIGIIIAIYLTKDSASLPSYPVWRADLFSWKSLGILYVLEWALIVAAVVYAGQRWRDPLLLASVACLSIFPLYWFGGANDFMMRATAPAIVVLAAICARTILETPLQRSLPLIMVLTLGATTALGELTRVISQPVAERYIDWNIEKAAPDAFAAQYLSRRPFVLRTN